MFKGSMVAIATPMNEDGSLDFDSLENLINFHVANETDAIVSVGTTGESATLDFEEHSQVIQATVNIANKRIPVIAGTGANSTSEAIQLTQKSKDLGFSGKGSIHPKQIDQLNKIFTPSDEEVAYANKVIQAFNDASDGLVVVDGKLIEKPVLRTALKVIANSQN